MSLKASLRSIPAMYRLGFLSAIAYRAEMLIWILSTTMPLVMLALWHAVARESPVGRFGESDFVAYFLSMFVVRQLTGSWIVWLMNMEVKDGTMALRMLRPVHPLLSYAVSSLAELPVRCMLGVPLAFGALLVLARDRLAHDPAVWALWVLSVMGAWTLTLVSNLAIGCLALYVESSVKIMDIWLALYFVFSGYMVPVEIFPPGLRAAIGWMPFRYQLGLPVEIMTNAWDIPTIVQLLGRQFGWIVLILGIVAILWKRGVRRFDAFGG